jgi:hypothetical protein
MKFLKKLFSKKSSELVEIPQQWESCKLTGFSPSSIDPLYLCRHVNVEVTIGASKEDLILKPLSHVTFDRERLHAFLEKAKKNNPNLNINWQLKNPKDVEPKLANAITYKEGDIGEVKWNIEHNKDSLIFSNNNQTIEWNPKNGQTAFLPATTSLHLHSGKFVWDFNIEEMSSAQIGVGFMLLWDNGLLDWGFFGYLGAGFFAWAYDPSTGDVVNAEKSIQGGLPKFENKHTGIITVELNLPRNAEGVGKFIVNGVESNPIKLPIGAVVVPAATLLKKDQKITIANFKTQ